MTIPKFKKFNIEAYKPGKSKIKKLKKIINIFFNIDKKYYIKSYLLNSEFKIIHKYVKNSNIPINIYSKKGCDDITKYIKKNIKIYILIV